MILYFSPYISKSSLTRLQCLLASSSSIIGMMTQTCFGTIFCLLVIVSAEYPVSWRRS